MKRFSTWETVLLLWILGLVGIVIAGQAQGQTIAFPTTPVGGVSGNPSNPVQVGPATILGGGYTGDVVVAQCQWGPCSYNVVTHAIWQDVIACSECAQGRGGRFTTGICDNHQGVSMVFVAPAGYIVADNYLASTCPLSPAPPPNAQAYKVVNGVASFVWGPDLPGGVKALRGFVGSKAYFSGSPCTVIDMGVPDSMQLGVTCPPSYDALQTADSQGNTWTLSVIPNGIKVNTTGPTPTPSAIAPSATPTLTPSFVSSPTRTATLGPATTTRTPTPTSAVPPTATPGTCPAGMCFIVNACVPCQPPSTPAGGGTPIPTFTPSRTPTPNCPVITVVVTATPHHSVRVVAPRNVE